MTDREEREEHIKRLEAALACEEKQSSGKCSKQTCDDNCALLYEQGNWGEWKETLKYAINSLKIDLKYDLLYEETSGQADKQADKPTTKNNLGVDWESYKDVDGNCLDDLILEVLQNNFDCGNTYGYKVADEIIGLLPSVTPQEPRWIPVNEKLPEDRREVLVTAYWHETYQVMMASYFGDGLWWCVPYNNCGEHMQRLKPKAWMPLPKAYREVEE